MASPRVKTIGIYFVLLFLGLQADLTREHLSAQNACHANQKVESHDFLEIYATGNNLEVYGVMSHVLHAY